MKRDWLMRAALDFRTIVFGCACHYMRGACAADATSIDGRCTQVTTCSSIQWIDVNTPRLRAYVSLRLHQAAWRRSSRRRLTRGRRGTSSACCAPAHCPPGCSTRHRPAAARARGWSAAWTAGCAPRSPPSARGSTRRCRTKYPGRCALRRMRDAAVSAARRIAPRAGDRRSGSAPLL